MEPRLNLAPAANEIEISLFGPGYGECVLVHLGENRWLIVDSCIEPQTRHVPVLRYLQALGVEPAQAVKLIAASHWHDDHVRGLSSLIEQCEQAAFWLPEAMSSAEFITLLSAYSDHFSNADVGAGCRELYRVVQLLRDSDRQPKRALADMCLYSTPWADGTSCKVYALSPSQAAGLTAVRDFGTYLQAQQPRLRLLPGKPNHLAMVLWLEIGPLRILLGADLEETSDPRTGWSVILSDSTCTEGRASLFKVPHHGSVTGHCQGVWETLLEPQPIALLTPFAKGRQKLPQAEDEQRLCALTDDVYITTPHTPKPPKRPKIVNRSIERMAARLSTVQYSMGHIRCRLTLDSSPTEWNVSLLNEARQLCL